MSDALERNKRNVVAFYNLMFSDWRQLEIPISDN